MTKQETLENIGMQLRIGRIKKRLTQGDVGKLVNIRQSAISAYERGEKSPSFVMVKSLEAVLECTIEIGKEL